MSNKFALFLVIVIVTAFAADQFYLHWDMHIILGKLLADVSEYLAFWR